MTERYTGWTTFTTRHAAPVPREVPGFATKEQYDAFHAPASSDLISAFTPINQTRHETKNSRQASEDGQYSSQGSNRHPPVIAQYLGVGSQDADDSHLDRLASVNVTPPASPSEKNIPKRKRAGERTAREVKQAAKRTKSDSIDGDEYKPTAQALPVTSRPKTARRRAAETTHDYSDRNSFERILGPEDDSQSLQYISPSQQTLSKLSSWDYGSQPSRAPPSVKLPQQYSGTISLVSPVTSMDRFQALRNDDSFQTRPSQEEPQQTYEPPPPPRQTKSVRPPRRAPSTGQALNTIQEETASAKSSQISGRSQSVNHAATRPSHYTTAALPGPTKSPDIVPFVQPSSSLVSTSKERFPPVERRHKIIDPEPIQYAEDDLDDFMSLDDEDLLELDAGSGQNVDSAAFIPPHPGKVATIKQTFGSLPTPQPSDETLFDDIDEEVFLQFSDLENLEVDTVDLTAAKVGAEKSTEKDRQNAKISLPTQRRPSRAIHIDKSDRDVQVSSSPPGSMAQSLGHDDSSNAIMTPFARPKFPQPIRDRSPLLNITSNVVLKTCFRIGEAINIGAQYARESSTCTSDGILIELYARVISSHRPACNSGARQDFIFADLWSKKGPQLRGEWTSFKGSKVFEQDASNLLIDSEDQAAGETKMCRVIGKLQREKKEWIFLVMSAWQCGWDDVEHVRGIVCYDQK